MAQMVMLRNDFSIHPLLSEVQPRKTRPCLTERLLMGRKESNQTNKRFNLQLMCTHSCDLLGKIIIRSHHECEGEIEKSVPRFTNWHHEACRVMTNGDRKGRFFYPILTQIMDSFSCSPFNTSFYLGKT